MYLATLGAPAIGINVIGRSVEYTLYAWNLQFVCPAETISVSVTLDCTGTTKGIMHGCVLDQQKACG